MRMNELKLEGRALLVASTGGHLAQLVKLSERLVADPDPLWVTFENDQSRSLLEGRRVLYVPYIAPRDFKNVARASKEIQPHLREIDVALSTGSAIALAALPQAAMRRLRSVYVESVSRFEGPSLTGRIMAKVPGVETYSQHERWSSPRWPVISSVLNDFQTESKETRPDPRSMRVFVTLGTIRPYRFDSLVDAVLGLDIDHDNIVWQLGSTSREGLPGQIHESIPRSEFERLVKTSDVVISHAGVGSVLDFLDLGVVPVMVPRRSARAEHVDDHQLQVGLALAPLDLVVSAESDSLTLDHLMKASSTRVVSKGSQRK